MSGTGTVLVVGAGIQGRAAIADLERSERVRRVIAADLDARSLQSFLRSVEAHKTEAVSLDVCDREALKQLMARGVDVAISFVPVRLEFAVAEAAVDAGVNLVTTNYARALQDLHDRAIAAGVTILPESGFDPGIDLVIARHAVDQFDRVDTLNSYGSGIPAPECRETNALRYKISWSFEGVLASYARSASFIAGGVERGVDANAIFRPASRHAVAVDGVGTLEAFANGDAIAIVDQLRLRGAIDDAGRYTLRWPGHCDFWEKISALGLLDDTPGDGGSPSPREFLHRHLEPQLQYGPDERDMIILRVDVAGVRNGIRSARRYDLVAYRDLQTGMLAMSRVVGGPASIVAQMILAGGIAHPGVGTPIRDVPSAPFFAELAKRGIHVTEHVIDPAECYRARTT